MRRATCSCCRPCARMLVPVEPLSHWALPGMKCILSHVGSQYELKPSTNDVCVRPHNDVGNAGFYYRHPCTLEEQHASEVLRQCRSTAARLHEPGEVLGHAHGLLQAHDLLLDGVDLLDLQLLAGAVALPPVPVVDEPLQRPDALCNRSFGESTALRLKPILTNLSGRQAEDVQTYQRQRSIGTVCCSTIPCFHIPGRRLGPLLRLVLVAAARVPLDVGPRVRDARRRAAQPAEVLQRGTAARQRTVLPFCVCKNASYKHIESILHQCVCYSISTKTTTFYSTQYKPNSCVQGP